MLPKIKLLRHQTSGLILLIQEYETIIMEIIDKPSGQIQEETCTGMIEQTFIDLEIDSSLALAMNRWKDTLFRHDFSGDFSNYFRRVESFNGYVAGDHNALGFAYDAIGQLCGTVGQLKYTISQADNQGRELTEDEIEGARQNFHKAALLRGRNADSYKESNEYLSSLHKFEQEQLILLAENVPSIVRVIREVDKRYVNGESLF